MSLSIAVVGSGMAGLAAARQCRDAGHRVTVFEARQGHGMDAHSLHLHGGLVDVPLRVMSPQAWSSVLALADRVGVGTFTVDTYTTCSDLSGDSWFAGSRLPLLNWPWVRSVRYLNRDTWRLARGLRQLRRATGQLVDEQLLLRDFIAEQDFDPVFWRGLVLPILTTICTCREEHLLAWPAKPLLTLLDTIVHGDTLRRLQGGTPALVRALADGLDLIAGSPVRQVQLQADGVRVENTRGEGGHFDRVIMAVQANQLDSLDGEQFQRERQLLGDIRFDQGELWVHADARFLPRRRADWSALHFQSDPSRAQVMFTVWVNAVEPSLRQAPPVLQTWNPLFEPAADKTHCRVPLARAVVHGGTRSVQTRLADLHAEPGRRVFFCGSWAWPGVPLLESAVRSADAVCAHLPA